MAQKVNTTKSMKEKTVTAAELDKQMKEASKRLGETKKVEVMIPEYLRKRVGNNVPVGVNGAVIHVPVGQKVKIPEPMAKLLQESLLNLKL